VDFTNAQGLAVGSSWAHLMGYSYNRDPNFRHCFDVLTARPGYGAWELPGCSLSSGSSGGPGLPNPTTNGKLYGVISYGSTGGSPGMGGPTLQNNSFSCIFEKAKVADGNVVLKYAGIPCKITKPSLTSPTEGPRPTSAPVRPPTSTRACSTYKYRSTCRARLGCNWVLGVCKNI
jgi:hypothetical protein